VAVFGIGRIAKRDCAFRVGYQPTSKLSKKSY